MAVLVANPDLSLQAQSSQKLEDSYSYFADDSNKPDLDLCKKKELPWLTHYIDCFQFNSILDFHPSQLGESA